MGLYIALGIIGGVVIILALWIIIVYNAFIRKRNRVENGFSQIDIQCKKRFDLVPNLVEIVKGYAKHEKETLENVIAARNSGVASTGASGLASADLRLNNTLSRIFALSEAYPDLKANTSFLSLRDELIALEKAIAISRAFYNDAVMIFNNAIMVFPNSIITKLFRFKKAEFFNASDAERQNVNVKI